MGVVHLPSVSSPPLCCRKPRNSAASSLFPLDISLLALRFTCRGHILWNFSCKKVTLRTPCKPVQNIILCSQRKHLSPLWCHHNPQKEFCRPCEFTRSPGTKEWSRNTVVRSDLAGAASPDFAYPKSELRLASKIRGICFYAVTAVAAIFLFVLMLVGHPLVLLFDRYRRRFHHLIARAWAIITVTPFFKIEYEGLENLPSPDAPAVYVSNHQSFLDIYTLLTLGRGFKFISKTGIFVFPIIGWAMFMMGVIPLKRMDSRSQMECLKRCMDLVKRGASVFFFPEGTRSKDGTLGPFKKGAFSVASRTGVPVVPLTLIGTGKIMPAGKEGIVNPGSVKVVIHKPIEGRDAESLCNQARDIIASEAKT